MCVCTQLFTHFQDLSSSSSSICHTLPNGIVCGCVRVCEGVCVCVCVCVCVYFHSYPTLWCCGAHVAQDTLARRRTVCSRRHQAMTVCWICDALVLRCVHQPFCHGFLTIAGVALRRLVLQRLKGRLRTDRCKIRKVEQGSFVRTVPALTLRVCL